MDGFKNVDKAEAQIAKQKIEKCVHEDLKTKITKPRLLCQIKEAIVENVQMTWSRMAICYRRGIIIYILNVLC